MKELRVRLADFTDSADIFMWRNDETTRAMSHSTDLVGWEEHGAWYRATLNNPQCYVLICLCATTHEKVAVVRLNVANKAAMISINLSPVMRGKGLAGICLSDAIAYFASLNTGVACIEAEVKPINVASCKAFEKASFCVDEERDDIVRYRLTI